MPVVSIRFFLILLSSTLGVVETTATIGSQVHLLHHPHDRKHIGPSNGVHLHPMSPPSESDELIPLRSDDVEGKRIKELLRPGVGWKKSIREGTAEEERRAVASFLKPQAQPSDSHDQNGESFEGGSTSSETAKKRSLGKTHAHRLEEPTQINNTPTHSVISDIRSTGLISTYSNNSAPPSLIKQREPKIQPVHETDGEGRDTFDRHLIHHVHEEDTAPLVEGGKVLEAPEKEGTKTYYLPSMPVALSQTQIIIGIIFGVFVIVCLIGFACISRSKPLDIMDPRFSSGSSCKNSDTASIDSNDFQPYDVKDLSQKQL